MKRILFPILIIFTFIFDVISKPIDTTLAKTVGRNFINTRITSKTIEPNPILNLIYTSSSKSKGVTSNLNLINYFFVFNINQNHGFVIVSADDVVIPVLGYSDEKGFEPTQIPVHVESWLEGYRKQIGFAIDSKLTATYNITKEWTELLAGIITEQKLNKKGGADYLLRTSWNQWPYYNDLCPLYDITENYRCPTGCVATSMAQIMKYWNYPNKGVGSHSYTHNAYGTLSANFGNTIYNWLSMPNSINSPSKEIATLIYHCGVSVNMDYYRNGSGAYVTGPTNTAEYAFKTYFGYKSAIKGVFKNNYTQAQWITLVKSEIDSKRPILYRGDGSGGHAFVGDGYDNNDYIHFNWGWGGYYDGFFNLNSLNPGSSNNYSNNQAALIGIEPTTANKYNPVISTALKTNTSKINYGVGFTVTTNITNKGTNDVCGTYCMAIFDVNHKFMAFVDSFQEFNCLAVNATYKNNLTFYFKGSDSLTTGKYNIEMYFKPFGGYWQRVLASSQSIADVGPIEVVHPNYIYLNSEIKLNRSELMQEEPVTVSLNLLNKERKTFFGQYRVCLLNLDSTLKESIDTLYETKGLLYNNSYPSPYMSFKSSEIVADSGKYLLAIQFKADSTNDWVLAGSKYFKSLFQVNVLPQPYKPDKYEVNNTYETSYSLPVIFKNDTAEVKTTGSNLHKKTDLDYYKIVLPPGYQYLINARLQDIKSCNNGEIYTANALFYTFTSSGIWSEAYDSMMTSSFEMKGGSFNFYVLPDNTVSFGTYLLDIHIVRTSVTAKNITGFTVAGLFANVLIDESTATVYATVNKLSNLTQLKPVITISDLASINPASGIITDFTKPVKYTVTAADKSTKIWTVTITKQNSTDIYKSTISDFVKIYPNPANNFLKLNLTYLKIKSDQIKIMDIRGQIMPYFMSKETDGIYELDITEIPDGIYFIQFRTDQGIINKKVLISK